MFATVNGLIPCMMIPNFLKDFSFLTHYQSLLTSSRLFHFDNFLQGFAPSSTPEGIMHRNLRVLFPVFLNA